MEVVTILEVDDLVVAVPPRDRVAHLSLPVDRAPLTAVEAEPRVATALARAVVGLAPPISGRVLVGGRDVTDLPPGSRQIGYVPAGGALLPHLTVRRNIEYLLWRRETVRDMIRTWQATLVHQLELGPVLDQRPHEITPQQRIRGAVARAVVSLPEVLVFDLPDAAATGPLTDLLARIESPFTSGPSTVVCTAAGPLLAEADRVVPATVSPMAVVHR
jgi:ABC-type proline/glycine betaine transport system ATPase subunit